MQHCTRVGTPEHHSSSLSHMCPSTPGRTRRVTRMEMLCWSELRTWHRTDMRAHATPADTPSHAPGRGQGADTGTPRCAHAACTAAAKAAWHGSTGMPAPAQNTHAAHTYTNVIFLPPDTQTYTDTQPASSPSSHPSLPVLREVMGCGETPISACPLSASVSPRAGLC